MLQLLWLVPALPLAGFLLLFATGGRLPKGAVTAIALATTGLSALIAMIVAGEFLAAPPEGEAYRQVLWTWIGVGDFTAQIALRLDALSVLMMFVVTFVGFLIHLYSTGFMAQDDGYSRFFAYMNLFVAAMLLLVLADNMLLLYLGWEGVGLCSYLLIGFWYRDPANGYAARKAFVVTRVGDTAMAIGLILLFVELGTLDIQPLMDRAQATWPVGSPLATLAAALLLGGAVGKSAQLPLQTWLPDAMAGPTPVSALIHAATMVTAGVYLIARTHVLFQLAPAVQLAVAVIGATTLLLAAFSALNQHDLKRILAYSTMSQIGYMFLALGVGAWSAAMLHFMTHAFFKALLFLAAGAVMMRVADEHDIFRMGGLRRDMPLVYWTFLAGAAALAALPLVTSGFYSKDMILWAAWNFQPGGRILWTAGFVGAILTAFYIFRAFFVVFHGEQHTLPVGTTHWRIGVPLVVLAVLALVAGFVETPAALGHVQAFARFLAPVLPMAEGASADRATQTLSMAITAAAALAAVYCAYRVYCKGSPAPARFLQSGAAQTLHRFWLAGWGFDWLYEHLIVRPFVWIARANRSDFFDAIYEAIADGAQRAHVGMSRTQNGRVRRYAGWLAAGSVATLAIAVFA
ncbi:MAG: NADH-quinone oxidoreductase subunit L [Betaproteobacteria bacterium]|nr:NADH-quinone oxidoreductase subunit L [Betaproteobacteria bacterium]